MTNEKTCPPLFGSDDEDSLVERALAELRKDVRYVETTPAESFIDVRGPRGDEVAYVVLVWARSIGEPDDHTVYRCRRDAAGRVRLTLLDPAEYQVEGRALTLKSDARTIDGRGDVGGRVRSMLTGTPYGAEPRPPLDNRSAEREDVGAEDEG